MNSGEILAVFDELVGAQRGMRGGNIPEEVVAEIGQRARRPSGRGALFTPCATTGGRSQTAADGGTLRSRAADLSMLPPRPRLDFDCISISNGISGLQVLLSQGGGGVSRAWKVKSLESIGFEDDLKLTPPPVRCR